MLWLFTLVLLLRRAGQLPSRLLGASAQHSDGEPETRSDGEPVAVSQCKSTAVVPAPDGAELDAAAARAPQGADHAMAQPGVVATVGGADMTIASASCVEATARKQTGTLYMQEVEEGQRGRRRTCGGGSLFRGWLLLLWAILGIMTLSGSMLSVPAFVSLAGARPVPAATEGILAMLALLVYVPFLPVSKILEQRVDAYLMEHGSARAPSLVYWSNVLLAVVVWPNLALKWFVVRSVPEDVAISVGRGDGSIGAANGVGGGQLGGASCGTRQAAETARESRELGLVVCLSCTLLLLSALYYTLIDPYVGQRASLSRALERHRCSMSLAAAGNVGSASSAPMESAEARTAQNRAPSHDSELSEASVCTYVSGASRQSVDCCTACNTRV